MKQHIFLCGYRGTGKTSVGEILAKTLACPLIDTDQAVLRRAAGPTIAEIFQQQGEEAFRDLETDCLLEIAKSTKPSVIALGGGAVLRQRNRDCITSSGVCVWLQAEPATLAKRIRDDSASTDNRPALTEKGVLDEIREVLFQRTPIYQNVADFVVKTDGKSVQEIAAEAIILLEEPSR